MFDSKESGGAGSIWGIVIFLIILFFVFNNKDANGRGQECSTFDNHKAISDIQCSIGRNDAVLLGSLETGFRTVLDNDNVNTARILDGQKDLYIKTLERENTNMFVTSQNQETRTLMLMQQAGLDRRLDGIECKMLDKPPVYPQTCVPCSTNPFASSCGNGFMA